MEHSKRRQHHAAFARIERGELAVERGWLCSVHDRIRRFVIHEILCNLRVDYADFEWRFGIPFLDYFAREMEKIKALEADGLVKLPAGELRVTFPGRLLLRNIAMVFDSYLKRNLAARPTYSRTV